MRDLYARTDQNIRLAIATMPVHTPIALEHADRQPNFTITASLRQDVEIFPPRRFQQILQHILFFDEDVGSMSRRPQVGYDMLKEVEVRRVTEMEEVVHAITQSAKRRAGCFELRFVR